MTTATEEAIVAQATSQTAGNTSIRPFSYRATDEELNDLRRRVAAVRLPDKEPVSDFSQGVKLATVQKLARYWATEYDWRKVEARMNALPHFITEIDGLDIHFIHARSKHANALPIIVTHGWPGSVVEQLKIVDPLTNPTAHGGTAADAFHVVIPSMPGYGFSGKPTETGWGPARIARAWAVLMKRLGYTKYVAQGGDWGAIITDVMATQGHPELIGIHTNMANVIPPDIDKLAQTGAPAPSDLSADETSRVRAVGVCICEGRRLRIPAGTAPADRCMEWRIHLSAWQPTSWTTTRAVWSSSRAPLTGSPLALRGTISSTTSRSRG